MNKISVIIPCYNQGRFLNQTLQSIFDQTHDDWECIVINDGSTDNTAKIAQEWSSRDSRFKLIEQKNSGRSAARNAGLGLITGDFIQFLDGDDMLAKEKFAASLAEFEKDANTGIVISNFQILEDKTGKILPPFCELRPELFNYQTILIGWDKEINIPIHCAIFKKEVLSNFKYHEDLNAPEDWVMWLYVFNQNTKCKYFNRELAIYRFHSSNTFNNDLHVGREMRKAYRHVFKDLTEEHQILFFELTLERWEQEAHKVENLRNSTSFKIGGKIVKAANFLLRKKSKE